MEMVEVRVPEWREETGKCLNCGKETPFYDGGYFCTYECRKEYEERLKNMKEKYPRIVFAYAILLDNKIENWYVGTTNRSNIREFNGCWKVNRLNEYRLEKKCYICANREEYNKVFEELAPKWFKTWEHADDYSFIRAY